MKTIEITQPYGVMRLTEPARYIFYPEAIGGEIWGAKSASGSILDIPRMRATEQIHNRAIGWEAEDFTVNQPDIDGGYEYGTAWYGMADRSKIIGGSIRHCAVHHYGIAGGTRGADDVAIEGLVCEDGRISLRPDGTHNDEHLFAIQNGSRGYFDVTLRRSAPGGYGFVDYQTSKNGVAFPSKFNTYKVKVEDVDMRGFDFGGDGVIRDGESHEGNQLFLEATRCGVGMRLKALRSRRLWSGTAILTDCRVPVSYFPGTEFDMDIQLRKAA
jgi:hypothetical protein